MADQRAEYEIRLKDRFSQGLSKLDRLVDKFERNVEGVSKQSTKSFADVGKLDGGVDEFGRNVERVSKRSTKSFSTIRKSFDSIGKSLGALGLAVGAGALIKNIANLGIEMEQTRVSFSTFLGDAEKANKVIADLNKFSNVTPFDNAQVIKAGKGLLAFGTSSEKLIPALKQIGDISAGTGKDFNELATIYGKARVAGTLYAEDINQLVEAGVPIMGEFAKALGTTEANVKKMASQGKLKFKDLETAFKNLTSEGGMFFDLMDKQSKTVGGRLSTLAGSLQTIGIAIGEGLLPAIGFFADFALGISKNIEGLKTFGIVIGVAAAALGVYKLATLANTVATLGFTGAIQALGLAFTANPIGLVVAGLAAIAAGLVIAWRHSETFRGVILGLWESAKTVFNNLKNGFQKIPNIILESIKGIPQAIADTFKDVGSLFAAIFSGDFRSIPGILKNLGANIAKTNPVSAVGMGLFEEFGKGAGEAFDRGFAKGKSPEEDAKKSKGLIGPTEKELAKLIIPDLKDTLDKKSNAASGSKILSETNATSGSEISSAITGSSPKNVTLNITKLVETINFHQQNMKQNANDMTEQVKRALLVALNDVAIVQR